MRRIVLLSILSVALAFLLPLLLSPAAPAGEAEAAGQDELLRATEEAETPVLDDGVFLTVRTEDGDAALTMAEYLPLALAGEMPASFEPEALRAQAVALRSYAMYCRENRKTRHPEADVCTDPGCCAAYADVDVLRASWGGNFDAYWAKIEAAVRDTDGQYLAYEGAPALAVFHASSYRSTEDGAALGLGAPYLASVATPEDGAAVRNLHSTVEISREDFKATIQGAFPGAVLDDADPAAWVGELRLDAAGRVAEAELGGVVVSGLALRQLFSLRSTDFTLAWDGTADCFVFRVSGYGHGLGLSQYGANLMAKDGADYFEILKHYYPGTILVMNYEGKYSLR